MTNPSASDCGLHLLADGDLDRVVGGVNPETEELPGCGNECPFDTTGGGGEGGGNSGGSSG